MKIQCRAQDERGWQTERFVQAGTNPMLHGCITWWIFFYFVDTSVTGSSTSALCLVLSGIHNLLFLVKCTRQQCI